MVLKLLSPSGRLVLKLLSPAGRALSSGHCRAQSVVLKLLCPAGRALSSEALQGRVSGYFVFKS